MAHSPSSTHSSEPDDKAYPHGLASSLAGLPVRAVATGAAVEDASDAASANGAAAAHPTAKSGQLKEILDLADGVRVGPARSAYQS